MKIKTKQGQLTFRCNICGELAISHMSKLTREQASCQQCGSTLRMRSLIHVLSLALFNASLCLADFPTRKDIKGIGMSDWDGYAIPLAKKLDYTNTYYHQAPYLDITHIDEDQVGTLDFIISTDVYEHITPPVQIAFDNARRLLKPNGVMIFSVPYAVEGETQEHFPDLHEFEFNADQTELINTTRAGEQQRFDDLCFHGGPGSTLEMRVFSEADLVRDFHAAGFQHIIFHHQPRFGYGIYWRVLSGLPISARAWRVPTIEHWTPNQCQVNQGFNQQADDPDKAVFSIQGKDLNYIRAIYLGEQCLSRPIYNQDGTALSAAISVALLNTLGCLSLQAELYSGDRVEIGEFEILPEAVIEG